VEVWDERYFQRPMAWTVRSQSSYPCRASGRGARSNKRFEILPLRLHCAHLLLPFQTRPADRAHLTPRCKPATRFNWQIEQHLELDATAKTPTSLHPSLTKSKLGLFLSLSQTTCTPRRPSSARLLSNKHQFLHQLLSSITLQPISLPSIHQHAFPHSPSRGAQGPFQPQGQGRRRYRCFRTHWNRN
jgi:hypothetical protein